VKRKRQGFTLVEILAAVAIIAILVGLLFLGAKRVGASARNRKTQVTLKTLQGLLADFEAGGGRMDMITNLYSGNANQEIMPQGVVADDFAASNPSLTAANGPLEHTRFVMLSLSSVPANKAILEKLPPEMFMKDPTTKLAMAGPILLDAWNSPILFAPGRPPNAAANAKWGASGMTIANQANSVFQPPDGKGMFISAGEDTDFSKGDDNLYSYER